MILLTDSEVILDSKTGDHRTLNILIVLGVHKPLLLNIVRVFIHTLLSVNS